MLQLLITASIANPPAQPLLWYQCYGLNDNNSDSRITGEKKIQLKKPMQHWKRKFCFFFFSKSSTKSNKAFFLFVDQPKVNAEKKRKKLQKKIAKKKKKEVEKFVEKNRLPYNW